MANYISIAAVQDRYKKYYVKSDDADVSTL